MEDVQRLQLISQCFSKIGYTTSPLGLVDDSKNTHLFKKCTNQVQFEASF